MDLEYMCSNEISSVKGIDLENIETFKHKLIEAKFHKKIRFVSHWLWWDIKSTSDTIMLMDRLEIKPAALYSDNLVWDQYGIFPVGYCIKSTLLTRLEKFEGANLFVTKNTIYVLVGPGRRADITLNQYNGIFF